MVVAAHDSTGMEAGFAADADAVMPEQPDGLMPTDVDEAGPSEWDATDEAATDEVEASPFDLSSLTPEQQQYLADHFGSEAAQRFERDRRNLQQTLERQKTELARENTRLNNRLNIVVQRAEQWLQQIANGEIEPDARLLKELKADLYEAEHFADQYETQRQTEWVQHVTGSVQRMNQFIAETAKGPDGRPLFDATHPRLAQPTKDLYTVVERHFRSITPQNPAGDPQLYLLAEKLKLEHQNLVKQLAAEEAQKRGKRASNQRVQQATQKQRQRGPQDRGRAAAAGGSGALELPDIIKQVQSEDAAKGVKRPYMEQYRDARNRYVNQ